MTDLCKSCARQNFCGNNITKYYCTGYMPYVETRWEADDIDVLTNEEWLKSMNTEQFAEALAWIEDRGELPTVRKENVKAFEKWLKEKHHG